ncbi:MAG: glycosyltransferase [Candidatus Hydrogenedentes bacterium]|nr:glycosyltransferase [Candidatus Hydrogenedentota bacterium]
MTQPVFSIVIPAFNEEKYLPQCLASVQKAAARTGGKVEIIVADNMSTDRTCDVARTHGAQVVSTPDKPISAVRNRGAAAATGKYLVFIDADDMMSENMLEEIKKVLDSGKYIGGGTAFVWADRISLGILVTGLMQYVSFLLTRVSLFLFYTTAEAYHAVEGFNEKLYASEDWDFAFRLKRKAKERGLKYHNMFRARVTKSARKFDEYGDWFIFRHPIKMIKAVFNNPEATYELWYRPRR